MNGGKRPHRPVWLASEPPDQASETNIRRGDVSVEIRRRVAGSGQPLGYTIVEVMIVLAVSGLMFIIAANFINGKQANTAFSQGVNGLASELQNLIQQVSDGAYSDVPLGCTFSGTHTDPDAAPGSGGQGTNTACVFLGKMVHILPENAPTHNYQYELLSIAGGRLAADGETPITSLIGPNNADPRVIDSLTTDQDVSQMLNAVNVTATDPSNATHQSFAFGFFQSLGATNADGTLQNGSQTVNLYYVNGLTAGVNPSSITSSSTLATSLEPAKSVDICIADDSTVGLSGERYADVIIGTNSDQLSVQVVQHETVKPPTC